MTLLTDMTARRGFLLLSGGALVALAGCSTTRPTPPVTAGATDETAGALPLVNALRAKHKLGSLSASKATAQAAQEQAVRMARAGEMKHLIGFGDDFGTRMRRNDVPLPAAENIASGQKSVGEAVQAWINSKKHLENMLGSYNYVGVAVARSGTDMRPYWAMVLSA